MPTIVTQLRVQRPTTSYGNVEQIVSPVAVGRRALILQGQPGQTAPLLDCQSSTAASLAAITADGWMRVGTQMSGIQTFIPVSVCAPYKDANTGSHLSLMTNDPQAVDKGAAITLGGARDDAGTVSTPFARLSAGKANGTAGDYGGYLSLWAQPMGASMRERLRIPSTGGLEVRDGGTVLAAVDATGNLDLKKHQLQNAVTHNLATPPAAPVEGQRYYDTVSKLERVWDGTKWTDLTDVWVGANAPTGTPAVGDLWYDSDDVSTLVLPLAIANGGTGATTAQAARTSLAVPDLPVAINQGGTGAITAATARAGLAVPAIGNSTTTGGAPTTGTWARGDQWLDSTNVLWVCTTGGTPGTWMAKNIGEELAYNQVTAPVAITSTVPASPNLIVEGTTRTYDGSPVLVEFYCPTVASSATSSQLYFMLWDGGADLGLISGSYGAGVAQLNVTVRATRRITPTAGSHNFRVVAYAVGSGNAYCGTGAASQWSPMSVRVTRA